MVRLGLFFALTFTSGAHAAKRVCNFSLTKPAWFSLTSAADSKVRRIPPAVLNLPDLSPLRDFLKTLGPNDVLVSKIAGFSKLRFFATRKGFWLARIYGARSLRMSKPHSVSEETVAELMSTHGSIVMAIFDQADLVFPLIPVLPIKAVYTLVRGTKPQQMAIVTLSPESFAHFETQLDEPLSFGKKVALPEGFSLVENETTRLVLAERSNLGDRIDQAVTGAVAVLSVALALIF